MLELFLYPLVEPTAAESTSPLGSNLNASRKPSGLLACKAQLNIKQDFRRIWSSGNVIRSTGSSKINIEIINSRHFSSNNNKAAQLMESTNVESTAPPPRTYYFV